jgi:hypothetical protein
MRTMKASSFVEPGRIALEESEDGGRMCNGNSDSHARTGASLGAQAVTTAGWATRAALHGELLAPCAGCHQGGC